MNIEYCFLIKPKLKVLSAFELFTLYKDVWFMKLNSCFYKPFLTAFILKQ